jgi:hypothetical protein
MRLVTIALLAACTQFGGCFFFWIPGGMVQSISDGITGAKGEHCVNSSAKVGDKVTMPYGGQGTIISLSGTSVRCGDPQRPIRAQIE